MRYLRIAMPLGSPRGLSNNFITIMHSSFCLPLSGSFRLFFLGLAGLLLAAFKNAQKIRLLLYEALSRYYRRLNQLRNQAAKLNLERPFTRCCKGNTANKTPTQKHWPMRSSAWLSRSSATATLMRLWLQRTQLWQRQKRFTG